jgi:hypothetical protein
MNISNSLKNLENKESSSESSEPNESSELAESSEPNTSAESSEPNTEETEVTEPLEETEVTEVNDNSVQIAPTTENNVNDAMLFIELGDRVVIDSQKYGRVTGVVYYRSLERISIKPDGVSNKLYDFEIEQTDDEELYKEDYGVTAAYVIEKRKFASFVEQQDFRINQMIDTFDSNGELYKSYKVVKVDIENDSIQIQDEEDTYDLNFNYIGIDSDEDIKIISIREFVNSEEAGESEVQEEVEVVEEDEEDEDEIEIIGTIDIIRPKIYEETAFFEQRIPDTIQKIDALNDFISDIDSSLQKDPRSLRIIRIFIETLFNLKQATISYNDDGTVKGTKDISVSTLSELINRVSVPLGRPVLNIKKKLYIQINTDKISHPSDETDEVYFEDFTREQELIIQNASVLVSSVMDGAPGGKIVREWNDQQNFLKKYLSPYSSNLSEPMWKAISDTDIFRLSPPDLEETEETEETKEKAKPVFLNTIEGYIATGVKENPVVFDTVPFGMERALSTTYRKGADRKKQVLVPEDASALVSYLLFPMKTSINLGRLRSSSLAVDSGRSQMKKDTMKGILSKIGGPTDVGTSNDLVLLDVAGNTLGNIPLADYIEGLSVPALGIGDTFATIDQYGIDQLELTPDIVKVLVTKIELYQLQLVNTLVEIRELINVEEKEPEQNPFLVSDILEVIRSQPILVDDIIEYERINPSLLQSDIGKIAYLMNRHMSYFQIAIGNNSTLIAKELLIANNAKYINSLRINNTIEYNTVHSGDAPNPNRCKHVKDLVAVKRIQDDNDRFKRFVDFFRGYQGGRDLNWINCNICKEHLICIHERLQIQAYLNIKEKDSIQKEIILKFSGGQFQGKYICRNCGQPIRDIDFDNNIEFDDNGKPKSGRNVLVDDDALFEEHLNNMISAPAAPSQKKELKLTDEEIQCYDIIQEISTRVGVNIDNTGIMTIIRKTISFVNKFPNRETYKGIQDQRAKEKRAKLPDYDVAMARNIITVSATFLLLEIQTKIPSYVIRSTLSGCKTTKFDGYPLDTDPTKIQDIEYMSCAISSIRRDDAPWNQTGFPLDELRRQQGIRSSIMDVIQQVFKQIIADNTIQSDLSEKRKYITTKTEHGVRDVIPLTFLPEQMIITPEDAANDVIIPEVANERNVKLWIRQAHLLAKKTASLTRGSPLIETSCCLGNIEQPSMFWHNSELPELAKRTLIPYKQGQFLITEFIPRPSVSDVVEPDSELYYRIFLKCCFQGPRIGYSHEPGLTNVCTWCGFQFPTIPSIMDTDTEGKSALASQNITIDNDAFVNLLDTIHNVNNVEPITIDEIITVNTLMEDFSLIEPPPIANWKQIIIDTTANFLQLPPDSMIDDIALASGQISDATSMAERIITERIKTASYIAILEDIVKLSWLNFFQVIQSYFIIPFQRMLTEFSSTSLIVQNELHIELSESHVVRDINPFLENDTSILRLKGQELKDARFSFAKSKIMYFLNQMKAILLYKNKIRAGVIPGGKDTLQYIQRILLYGPISTLINPDEMPEGIEVKSPIKEVGNTSKKYLHDIVVLTLGKFDKERLTFSDEQLKEKIAIRDEKERANIIAQYSKLTDEERAVELINQRLGLGKYAVGGTKLIYAYDKDYYDLERQKRLAAGIIEFPGSGNGDILPPDGRPMDNDGFRQYNDDELEEGYDHNQHVDDDNE